jgi:hypothetical protein
MARLSAYSRGSVYLTLFALLLVLMSTWMRWYIVSLESYVCGEFWLDYFNPIDSGGTQTYYFEEALGEVMTAVKFFIVMWFIVAAFFVANILSGEATANREFVTGGAIVAVGFLLLVYFAVAFPAASDPRYVSGFISTVTYQDRVYSATPGGGYVLAAIALFIQTVAVAMRFKIIFTGADDKPESEPFEGRVIDGSEEASSD